MGSWEVNARRLTGLCLLALGLALIGGHADAGVIVTEGRVASPQYIRIITRNRPAIGDDGGGGNAATGAPLQGEAIHRVRPKANGARAAVKMKQTTRGVYHGKTGNVTDLNSSPAGWTCRNIQGGIQLCVAKTGGTGAAPGAGASGRLGSAPTEAAPVEEVQSFGCEGGGSPVGAALWVAALLLLGLYVRRRRGRAVKAR